MSEHEFIYVHLGPQFLRNYMFCHVSANLTCISIYMVIRRLVTVAINTLPMCPKMCHGRAMGLCLTALCLSGVLSVNMSLHVTDVA